MFSVIFRNVRACSVKADSVLEKGPTPADVSAAICTETVEYFCTPGNVLNKNYLQSSYTQKEDQPSTRIERTLAGTEYI